MGKKEGNLGDAIAGIILIIGIIMVVVSMKDIRIVFYAPPIFWWGLGFVVGVAVYFTIRAKGVFKALGG